MLHKSYSQHERVEAIASALYIPYDQSFIHFQKFGDIIIKSLKINFMIENFPLKIGIVHSIMKLNTWYGNNLRTFVREKCAHFWILWIHQVTL